MFNTVELCIIFTIYSLFAIFCAIFHIIKKEYLRKYFNEGKTSISIQYRRKYSDGFKQVVMDMIPADDYSDDNQTLFLYVKNIDM